MSWDPVWEKVFNNQAWGKYPEPELIRFIARNFYQIADRRKVKILEVGCGTGSNLWFMAREGFSVTGVDGASAAINLAKQRLDDECPGWDQNGASLETGDIVELPFSNAMFDAVIDNEAIYANSYCDSQKIYTGLARVLKPGGKLFSRMFSDDAWGYGTGEQVGEHAFLVAEGPMKDKGYARFTRKFDIPELLGNFFAIDSIDWVSRSAGDDKEIKEWIVTGTKRG
jgi:SAM-dependent methyltransferase